MSSRKDQAGRFGAVATRRTTPPPPVQRAPRKYTILLAADVADDLDADVLGFQVAAGRRVDKSQVIRELVALLHEDPTVRGQVEERLRAAWSRSPL